jgi:predicted CXXCH cytochrome family protein
MGQSHRHRWAGHGAALALLLLAADAEAGEWHRLRTLVCSDCHTVHNSQGGRPMRYDDQPVGAPGLLRADGTTSVCLACHSGGRLASSAPAVTSPTNWDPPGGGFPSNLADPGHRAHALGATPVLPPQGDTPVVMTCQACHEPHGNDAYRNLRADPGGAGHGAPAPTVLQARLPGAAPPDQVYARSNLVYRAGMSQWCQSCHNLLSAEHAAAADVGLASHPWDRSLFGSAKVDFAAWSAVPANRVPVQNALGRPAPDPADQVFCLSCHKAHGSPNDAALINADGATRSSTCQQCHNV